MSRRVPRPKDIIRPGRSAQKRVAGSRLRIWYLFHELSDDLAGHVEACFGPVPASERFLVAFRRDGIRLVMRRSSTRRPLLLVSTSFSVVLSLRYRARPRRTRWV
jgi:hypothetical protein